LRSPHPSPFVHERWGGVRPKNPGQGGILRSLAGEGTPTPSLRYPTLPPFQQRGGVPSPARRMLHAKRSFWNWKQGGVGSPFLQKGWGGGLFAKKENRGEGGGNNFGGDPTPRIVLGRVMGRTFPSIAGSRPGIFL